MTLVSKTAAFSSVWRLTSANIATNLHGMYLTTDITKLVYILCLYVRYGEMKSMRTAHFDVARQVVAWSFLLDKCVLYDCDTHIFT